jgi:hypothetical protein
LTGASAFPPARFLRPGSWQSWATRSRPSAVTEDCLMN